MIIPTNIPRNPRKWVLIYGYNEGQIEYLSQEQFDYFMEAYNSGKSGISIDGRPYRTSVITAKLEREYNLNSPTYQPEDLFEILTEKANNFSDEQRAENKQKLIAKRSYETFVSNYCDQYNLTELKEKFFGGGEVNG